MTSGFFKNVVNSIREETTRIKKVLRDENTDDNIVEPPRR